MAVELSLYLFCLMIQVTCLPRYTDGGTGLRYRPDILDPPLLRASRGFRHSHIICQWLHRDTEERTESTKVVSVGLNSLLIYCKDVTRRPPGTALPLSQTAIDGPFWLNCGTKHTARGALEFTNSWRQPDTYGICDDEIPYEVDVGLNEITVKHRNVLMRSFSGLGDLLAHLVERRADEDENPDRGGKFPAVPFVTSTHEVIERTAMWSSVTCAEFDKALLTKA